jgi:sulfate adenylyltransferase
MSDLTRAQASEPLAGPIAPHGGRLVDRLVGSQAVRDAARKLVAKGLAVSVKDLRRSDLVMLATGAFSPLDGFLGQADYLSVLEHLRLANGTMWPLPVVLPVTEKLARGLKAGDAVALVHRGTPVGLMGVRDIYQRRRSAEALAVFRTLDPRHPGVARLMKESDWLLGGTIEYFGKLLESGGPIRYITPRESRREFQRRRWQTVVGFQTRNPVHRAHEYLIRAALETLDGLFLSPVVGPTKQDDVPADVRWECYNVLLAHYLPAERVVLGALDLAMRYAGPREALFHAIVRQNYGCTHFIVGRDHAGVGNFYGPTEAQRIFSQLRPDDLLIRPIFFGTAFYCRRCEALGTPRTCPHDSSAHVSLSGSQLRAILSEGKLPPKELVRPEVARVLMRAYGAPEPSGSNAAIEPEVAHT